MATINIVGFETGSVDINVELVSISGTASVQSSIKRTGAYALRCNPTTTNTGYADIQRQNNLNNVTINLATCYYRFYFRVDTLPASGSEEFVAILTTATRKFSLRVTSTGVIRAYDTSGTTQLGSDGTTVLSTGIWYEISIKCGTGASAAYEVKIDGVTELSGTGNLYINNNGKLLLGKVIDRNGQSVDFYYDDVAINDANYPAEGGIICLKADADGTYTTWTIGAGSGDDWQQVDDLPHDSDTTYLKSTQVVGQASTVGLESTAIGGVSETINTVKALIVVKDNGTLGRILCRLRSGTTDVDTAAYDLIGSYVTMGLIQDIDPNTGIAWTTSGIDAVEVGAVENRVSDASRMTAVYLMVDCIPEEIGGGARSFGYIF